MLHLGIDQPHTQLHTTRLQKASYLLFCDKLLYYFITFYGEIKRIITSTITEDFIIIRARKLRLIFVHLLQSKIQQHVIEIL